MKYLGDAGSKTLIRLEVNENFYGSKMFSDCFAVLHRGCVYLVCASWERHVSVTCVSQPIQSKLSPQLLSCPSLLSALHS